MAKVMKLLPIIYMVNSIRSNTIMKMANYEKYNTSCESLIENNNTSSNLFFNRPTESSCDDSENFTNTVTIGFLGAYGQAQVLLGALPLAVEAANNDESLLPGKRLNYVAANIGIPSTSGFPTSKSSSTQAIRVMTEMRDNGAIGFIGPDDICFPEALVAAAWNLPMISYVPQNQNGWLSIAQGFDNLWNLPHCLGALDGKHVMLQSPINSGSEYYNYKNYFSIVLFAVVDAQYTFTYVNAGCQGRISDGGVFKNCELYRRIENESLNFPEPTALPMRAEKVPYYFVGDEAFAISKNVMKPYSGYHNKGTKERIYNYRLCRARRVVENVFGIQSSVFRVLRKPMLLEPENASMVVMAIAHLHNFLRRNEEASTLYTPPGTFDNEVEGQVRPGNWRNDNGNNAGLLPLVNRPRRVNRSVQQIRDEIAEYCMREGAVIWQDEYA